MTTAPVLRLPDFDRQFCIETDASDVGIGVVLLQDNHPIAYFSKKLGPRRSPQQSAAEQLSLLVAVSHPVPQLIELLRNETASSPEMWEIMQEIKDGKAPPHLSMLDGLVYYHRRIFVGSRSSARIPILTEYHSSQSAGHPGFECTLRRVKAEFYWPNLKKEVRKFVQSCVVCQTTKYSTQNPAGLLQPLPIPSQVWEDV